MDILLGNPKTVLIQSIISTNYISDLYGERLKEKKEEKNKQELPLISNQQKEINTIKKEESDKFLKLKKRSQSQVSLMKRHIIPNKNEIQKEQMEKINEEIKKYALNIIENINENSFSFPNLLNYRTLLTILKENLKTFGKMLLQFFDKFQVNKNLDYQTILSKIFNIKFDNFENESSCITKYCVIGIYWKIEEINRDKRGKSWIRAQMKKEKPNNGNVLALKERLKFDFELRQRMESVNKEYNRQKSLIDKKDGEHAIYGIGNLLLENTLVGRDQRISNLHPKVFFEKYIISGKYVTNGKTSEGEWYFSPNSFFGKVGIIRDVYVMDDILLNDPAFN